MAGRERARWTAAAGIPSELVLVRTAGDKDRTTALRDLGGKGIFIKELEECLLDNSVDIAVHSMKDVPTELPKGLAISAMLKRHDVRDALISWAELPFAKLPAGARVGTSSLRRQAQLRHRRKDLEMADIRGNVDTRLGKLERGDYDAIVLAKAGLDRLGFEQRISEVLSTDICLPAAGQGAIGIEARIDDAEVLRAIAMLDDGETHVAVDAERIVLAGLEGGCQVPMGVWARIEGGALVVEACVLSGDGVETVRVRREAMPKDAARLAAEVTKALLDGGAGRLLKLAGAESRGGKPDGRSLGG